jgi:hypothetical protein
METLLRHREVLKMPDWTSGGASSSGRGDVVLSCDGSPEARVALGVAIEQAASFRVRLLVVFGVRPPGRGGGEGFKEHRRALELLGTKLGLRAVDEARAAGVEAEVLLVARRHFDADGRDASEAPLEGLTRTRVAPEAQGTSHRLARVVWVALWGSVRRGKGRGRSVDRTRIDAGVTRGTTLWF